MHEVLRATSRTLCEYLELRLGSGTDPIATRFADRSLQVFLRTPSEMAGREGLSFWLYQVVRDDQLLNQPRERVASRESRPSLPLRLHYLAAPILSQEDDSSPENEQLILGRVLQAMHDHPLFRGNDLAAELEGASTEFRVRLEPMALEEITRVWDALGSAYQLSVSYEVSVVEVASGLEPQPLSVVHELVADHGVIVGAAEAVP